MTGDYGTTALAIARNIGIANNSTRVITGVELEKMSDRELKEILTKENEPIFARIKPEHKLKVVDALKKIGHVVAMTGDGVNDAPALKRADIGIAMGITGTDVSKEASNMILTDDSYASIVQAVGEGRVIYQNLKKFIWFIVSSNIGEIFTIFISILLFLPSPLTAILILAVNVGTDMLPALALGLENAEKNIMEKPPRNPKEKMLNKFFLGRMTYMGVLIGLIVVGVYYWQLPKESGFFSAISSTNDNDLLKAESMAFITLVLTQLFNALNARSEHTSLFKLKPNHYLTIAIFISLLMAIAIVQIPVLQNLFHTESIKAWEWATLIGISSIVVIAEEIRKKIQAQKN
jgi:magnesium-transporting ATPase (P-type)